MRFPPKEFKAAEYQTFGKWLAFKQAEELGHDDEVRRTAGAIAAALNEFSPELSAFLEKRVAKATESPRSPDQDADDSRVKRKPTDSAPAAPRASTGDAVQDLVHRLANNQKWERLALAWKSVSNGERSPETRQNGRLESEWARLAEDPANQDVVDLRERAARQAIGKIVGALDKDMSDKPVELLLTDALERSCAAGSSEQIRYLLILEEAYGVLSPDVQRSYEAIADRLGGASKSQIDSASENSIVSCRALLSQTTSPAAARYAAEQLKQLRKR